MKCRYCDPATSTDAIVHIDGDIMSAYPARVRTDYRWNGWACPAFDFATAMKVCADSHTLAAEYGADGVEIASFDPATLEIVMFGGGRGAGDAPLRISATPCCGKYDIGAMNWTWHEANTQPEVGDLPAYTGVHLTSL
ncbi:hypothetical protein UFOVP1131_110 [uncultured Caudovirales phage]|uniref:Uncharacterized protein n=1 Tax=uncultured Caudovirales phage TaxID=2100421 RepID=A0A6J5RGF7_9CAUD|nr:hypothetical protein UFOVP966_1 [uncultured Caudovirales phage]CAB4184996.1 hypothetical protein UFOVP1131_110 [uncultured Caudovirales phage]CAB4192748.1 hypothetical protein UFOVP1245_76 [uncultured Caudovirales phage]CAB5231517.1 hypothetical protein UFOVP1582_102 [uncultured Caudovirales phage]